MKNLLDRLKFKGEIPEAPVVSKLIAGNSANFNPNQPTENINTGDNRRDFIKKAGLGGLSLGMMFNGNPAKEAEFITQKVNKFSSPSDLKITDIPFLDKVYTRDIISLESRKYEIEYYNYESVNEYNSEIILNVPTDKKISEIPESKTFTPLFLASWHIRKVLMAAGSPMGSSRAYTILGNS